MASTASTPSWSALCASWKPPTTSPTALTPGSPVRSMRPRDDATLDDDARPLDADVLDVGRPAHRYQEDLGLEPLLLAVLVGDGDGDAALVALDRAEVEDGDRSGT